MLGLLFIIAIVIIVVKLRKTSKGSKGNNTFDENWRDYENRGNYTPQRTYQRTSQRKPKWDSEDARIAGQRGEELIYRELSSKFPDARFITNLYIPHESDKGYSEVDIVMIHETGVYCIECKNYTGSLIGDLSKDKIQQKYEGSKCFTIYNPTKQNNTHVFNVRRVLGDKYFVHNCVIFAKDIHIPQVRGNSAFFIGCISDLWMFLEDVSSRKVILTNQDMIRIYNILNEYCNTNEKIRQNHIKYVKKHKFS